jgi:hypothetical protein
MPMLLNEVQKLTAQLAEEREWVRRLEDLVQQLVKSEN